jgi:hypothetical protein
MVTGLEKPEADCRFQGVPVEYGESRPHGQLQAQSRRVTGSAMAATHTASR